MSQPAESRPGLLTLPEHQLFTIPPEREGFPQTTDRVLMVRPDYFGFNPETAGTNSFQVVPTTSEEQTRQAALKEWEGAVRRLEKSGVNVITQPSRPNLVTPDAVFPNNWFGYFQDGTGTLVQFPMLNHNRQIERIPTTEFEDLLRGNGVRVGQVVDLTGYEHPSDPSQSRALEGTGSLVPDRVRGILYAIESPRTQVDPLREFAQYMGFHVVLFHAYDEKSEPIYHTNVIMGLGEHVAVFDGESVEDQVERNFVIQTLEATGKTIVLINRQQTADYCGNVIELRSQKGTPLIVMSERSRKAFTKSQLRVLENSAEIVPLEIPVIETVGGGSARCMIAEV